MKNWKMLFAVVYGLIVAACGGGGGDSAEEPADFSGTWNSSASGIAYSVVQDGSNVTMTRTAPVSDGIIYKGVVNGSTANVTAYINGISAGTSTVALISSTTATFTVNSCNPPSGYSCAPPGSVITATRVPGGTLTLPMLAYEREFNDDYAHATLFSLGETITGSLANPSDVDWYQVFIGTGGMVNATFDASSMDFGIFNVYWYAPDMTVMSGRNIGGGTGTSADQMKLTYSFPAFQKGTYWVRIQPSFATFYNGGGYKLNITSIT
jgi:hypothetical protein